MIEFVRYAADDTIIKCDKCQELKADLGEEPDCENCPAPRLWETNQEAWELYSRFINNQFVMDFHAFDFVFDTISRTWLTPKRPMEALQLLEKLILIHAEATKVFNERREQELKAKQQQRASHGSVRTR